MRFGSQPSPAAVPPAENNERPLQGLNSVCTRLDTYRSAVAIRMADASIRYDTVTFRDTQSRRQNILLLEEELRSMQHLLDAHPESSPALNAVRSRYHALLMRVSVSPEPDLLVPEAARLHLSLETILSRKIRNRILPRAVLFVLENFEHHRRQRRRS